VAVMEENTQEVGWKFKRVNESNTPEKSTTAKPALKN